MYYLYGIPLLLIEPTLLGIAAFSLVTKLIVLKQLPLLANSCFVFPCSHNRKGLPWNYIHFNIIFIPSLLLLISNLRKLPVCAIKQ